MIDSVQQLPLNPTNSGDIIGEVREDMLHTGIQIQFIKCKLSLFNISHMNFLLSLKNYTLN